MSTRVYVRKFDWEQAKRQHAEGLSYSEIGRRLGVSATAVARVCDPVQRARMDAVKARAQKGGTCTDCGGPSSYNYSKGSHRCWNCAAKAQAKVKHGTAYCPRCATWKPLDLFTPSKQNPGRGVRGECRACETARRKAWRKRNHEKQRTYDRERQQRIKAEA